MAERLDELVPSALLQLGSRPVAVPTERIEAVVRLDELMRVPLGPPSLAGIVVLGGEPAPVIDLSSVLGGPARRAVGGDAVLVCRGRSGPVVLLGGRILWVGRLRRSSLPGSERMAVGGVEWRASTLPLVDIDAVEEAVRLDGWNGGGQPGPARGGRRGGDEDHG